MKRIRIIGLCLVAMFAMSAVAAVPASAEAPEYGRCIKKAKKEGAGFSDAGCLKAVGTAATYEWQAGPGAKPKFTTKMTTASATLETVKGTKVICKKEESAGEVTGTKTIAVPSVKFNECTASGLKCNTKGAAVEEIVTEGLTGNLRVEKFGTEAKLNKLANELVPTSTPLFVEFECAGFKVEVKKEATGGLLNTLSSDKMLKATTDKYTATKGEQKPSEYESSKGVKVLAGLESNFGGGPFEEAGQTITSAQTNEEAIEANAVT